MQKTIFIKEESYSYREKIQMELGQGILNKGTDKKKEIINITGILCQSDAKTTISSK